MKNLIKLAKKLYPINRSITGKGIIKTLKIIKTSGLYLLKNRIIANRALLHKPFY